MSNGSLDDSVTSLNIPLVVQAHHASIIKTLSIIYFNTFTYKLYIFALWFQQGAAYLLRYYPLPAKKAFNKIINGTFKSQLFATQTVIELLFDGHDDPLLSPGTQLPEGIFPPLDKFAWFYQRNNSDYFDGVFSVFTGGDDIIKLGEMDMWNLTRRTEYKIFINILCNQR